MSSRSLGAWTASRQRQGELVGAAQVGDPLDPAEQVLRDLQPRPGWKEWSVLTSKQPDEDPHYDTEGAAAVVGCSAGYLAKLRMTGGGPDFHKLGKRKGIIYLHSDLKRWRDARRFGSTSEYPG